MKTPKELDVLRRIVWFEDTPEIVSKLKQLDLKDEAKHLHRMHIYHKNLIAEIRKLRRELRARGQE
jgi:hypothetical protein